MIDTIKGAISGLKDAVLGSIPLNLQIKEYYEKHGYEWQPENIIAIRNTDKKNDNTFSDCLSVVTDNEVVSYICTTVPGTTWNETLLKKFNVSGTGQYCLGFYPKLWTFGQHAGRALVQVGKADWYEDTDLDKKQGDSEKVYRNTYTHMDIHRTGIDGKPTVDQSSAGCNVPRYWADIDDLLKRCGWVTATPPKKFFNGLITDTDSFVFARDLMKLIKRK
jgi:hypothetical protein